MLNRRNKRSVKRKIRNLYDSFCIPVVVCWLYYSYKDDLARFMTEPSNGIPSAHEGHSVLDGPGVKDDGNLYDHHSSYITDENTDFLTSPYDCNARDKFVRRSSTRKGKQHNYSITYDALFMISSAAPNAYNRRMFRHIYSTFANTQPYQIRTIFLVGRASNPVTQAGIERETFQHGDMLQGNFTDHYSNLTYKTAMAYRWASVHCKEVKIILKMDDDVFLDIFKFFDYFLPLMQHRSRMIHGFLNFHPRVFREGKYRVAEKEYSGYQYPNFCSGFFVVPTRDTVDDIYEFSKTVKYLRLEDVFTYGLVRERMIDVQLSHLDVITYEHEVYKSCLSRYHYRCKFMAVEAPAEKLLEHFETAMEFRRRLGLPGGKVKT